MQAAVKIDAEGKPTKLEPLRHARKLAPSPSVLLAYERPTGNPDSGGPMMDAIWSWSAPITPGFAAECEKYLAGKSTEERAAIADSVWITCRIVRDPPSVSGEADAFGIHRGDKLLPEK